MFSHVCDFCAAAIVPVGGITALLLHRNHHNPDHARRQIDEALAHTLHCLIARGASDAELGRAIGGVRGLFHLMRQAGIHIDLLRGLGHNPDSSEREMREVRLQAILEALNRRRKHLPALRQFVTCYCSITTESDSALNDIDVERGSVFP